MPRQLDYDALIGAVADRLRELAGQDATVSVRLVGGAENGGIVRLPKIRGELPLIVGDDSGIADVDPEQLYMLTKFKDAKDNVIYIHMSVLKAMLDATDNPRMGRVSVTPKLAEEIRSRWPEILDMLRSLVADAQSYTASVQRPDGASPTIAPEEAYRFNAGAGITLDQLLGRIAEVTKDE